MGKYRYPITDAVTFALVMQEEEFCRDLISRLFPGRKIKKIHIKEPLNLETEKTIIASIDAKAVRLDVWFEDEDAVYDIEMQVENLKEIPKRSRYIHSIVDIENLKKGEKYNRLKKSFVIFLCCFDYFGLGEPLYMFESYDKKTCIPLGDEWYTVIVNATSKQEGACQELRNFMEYMMTGEVASSDAALKRIDDAVDSYNKGKGVATIMTIYDKMEAEYNKGLEEGIEQGKAEGLKEGEAKKAAEIAKSMKASGMKIEEIAKIINVSKIEVERIIKD